MSVYKNLPILAYASNPPYIVEPNGGIAFFDGCNVSEIDYTNGEVIIIKKGKVVEIRTSDGKIWTFGENDY